MVKIISGFLRVEKGLWMLKLVFWLSVVGLCVAALVAGWSAFKKRTSDQGPAQSWPHEEPEPANRSAVPPTSPWATGTEQH